VDRLHAACRVPVPVSVLIAPRRLSALPPVVGFKIDASAVLMVILLS
jgi:hypothetical protein